MNVLLVMNNKTSMAELSCQNYQDNKGFKKLCFILVFTFSGCFYFTN